MEAEAKRQVSTRWTWRDYLGAVRVRLCIGRDLADAGACAHFDKTTKDGKDMSAVQDLLAKAVASIVGKKEERAVASLFTPGGTHAMKGEFAGINDFEVVAFLVIQPDPATT